VKATKESLSPTRVKLTVEVPFDELKPSVDAAYRKLGKQVRVSGFRPGKVPPRILDHRLGREVVLDEALQEALPRFYSEAIQAEQVDVLSRPEVDVTNFTDGDPLVFTAEVDIRPELALPDYDGLEVVVDVPEITDEQVDAQLTSMRERHAVLKPVERPVATGDFVSIDLSAEVDGVEVEDAVATGLSYEVGSGTLIDGLDDAIVGAPEGETRTFDSRLVAGDHAGDTAQITVTVRGIKERDLPALDDDFATTSSEFDTLAELSADIRGKLERGRAQQLAADARDKALEALIGIVEVPLPESVVDAEIDARRHQLGHQLERFGMTQDEFLKAEGKSGELFETEMRDAAEQAIRAQFVLDKVIEKEQITLEEGELMQQIIMRAQRSGLAPEVYAQQLAQSDQIGAVMVDVLRGKALTRLVEKARVLDAAGVPVDTAPAVDGQDADVAGLLAEELATEELATEELADAEIADTEIIDAELVDHAPGGGTPVGDGAPADEADGEPGSAG
jgi:trigger factor